MKNANYMKGMAKDFNNPAAKIVGSTTPFAKAFNNPKVTMPTKMGVGMGKGQGMARRSSKAVSPLQRVRAMGKTNPNMKVR